MMDFLAMWLSHSIETFVELAPWLLFGLFLAGILHVFFPEGFVSRHLGGKGFLNVFYATMVGVPMPLCSCGVVPTAIGLKRDGASDGASVGFLISTPQTGVDSIMVSGAFLGLPFALFKIFSALVTGLVGGVVTNLFGGRGLPAPPPRERRQDARIHDRLAELLHFGFVSLLRDIYKWVFIGIVVAGFLAAILGGNRIFEQYAALQGIGGMLLMLVIALPMYVCAIASVPIAATLVVSGGLPAGAALVFLMAGPATNVATLGAIAKSFGKRITFIYVTTVAVFSVVFGMLFEWVIAVDPDRTGAMGHTVPHWLAHAAAVALAALMLAHALSPTLKRCLQRRKEKKLMSEQVLRLSVKGMTCQNCVRHVEKALSDVKGVVVAEVDLNTESATVKGEDFDVQELISAVTEAGYEAQSA